MAEGAWMRGMLEEIQAEADLISETIDCIGEESKGAKQVLSGAMIRLNTCLQQARKKLPKPSKGVSASAEKKSTVPQK